MLYSIFRYDNVFSTTWTLQSLGGIHCLICGFLKRVNGTFRTPLPRPNRITYSWEEKDIFVSRCHHYWSRSNNRIAVTFRQGISKLTSSQIRKETKEDGRTRSAVSVNSQYSFLLSVRCASKNLNGTFKSVDWQTTSSSVPTKSHRKSSWPISAFGTHIVVR